jgi:hypothetical protein
VTEATESYAALMERLRELDGTVLTAAEAQAVRDAADARLFGDDDQLEAAGAALATLDTLVSAARLSSRTRTILADLLCEIESVPRPSRRLSAEESEQS